MSEQHVPKSDGNFSSHTPREFQSAPKEEVTADSEQTAQTADRPAFELEPLVAPNVSRHVESTPTGPGARIDDTPVPARPLHLCPCCDYNLTGLRSRRCPECGEPFALPDARRRGFETSDEMKTLIRSTRWADGRKGVGITLVVASFIAVNWVRFNPIGGLSFYAKGFFSFRGIMFLSLILSCITLGAIIRAYLDLTWSTVLFVIGIFVATLAVGIVAL